MGLSCSGYVVVSWEGCGNTSVTPMQTVAQTQPPCNQVACHSHSRHQLIRQTRQTATERRPGPTDSPNTQRYVGVLCPTLRPDTDPFATVPFATTPSCHANPQPAVGQPQRGGGPCVSARPVELRRSVGVGERPAAVCLCYGLWLFRWLGCRGCCGGGSHVGEPGSGAGLPWPPLRCVCSIAPMSPAGVGWMHHAANVAKLHAADGFQDAGPPHSADPLTGFASSVVHFADDRCNPFFEGDRRPQRRDDLSKRQAGHLR